MAHELQALKVAKAFTPSDKSSGRKEISSRWMFEGQSSQLGEVVKAKARLVGGGLVKPRA